MTDHSIGSGKCKIVDISEAEIFVVGLVKLEMKSKIQSMTNFKQTETVGCNVYNIKVPEMFKNQLTSRLSHINI